MRIVEFENDNQATLELVIEPRDERYEIPHLARAGIRYVQREDSEDRCYTSVSDHRMYFWCDADSYEVDIVYPTPCQKLMWAICVEGGWCGGIVDDEPTTVRDLLPASGEITAREFAELAMKADGWPASEPFAESHLHWLEAKFVEHLGSASVDVELLRQPLVTPFESDST